MARYRVVRTFDMGMSRGEDELVFDAEDDEAAKKKLEEDAGGWLSSTRRNVRFKEETLARFVE